MLQIFIDNQELEINSEELSVELKSTVFEFDTIESGLIFPVTLPASEINNNILKYPRRELNKNIVNNFKHKIYFGNILFFEGSAEIKSMDSDLDCDFYIDDGNFYSQIKEKRLKSLYLGGQRTWAWKEVYSTIDDQFALFPVKADNFFEGTGFSATTTTIINDVDLAYLGGFRRPEVEAILETTAWAIVPFPALWYVLEQIFTEHGFLVNYNCFRDDEDLNKLVIFNNYNAVTMSSILIIKNTIDYWNMANHLPEISIAEFLIAIKSTFNVRYDIKNLKVEIRKNTEIFESLNYIDITEKTTDSKTIEFEVYDNIEIGFSGFDQNEFNISEQIRDYGIDIYGPTFLDNELAYIEASKEFHKKTISLENNVILFNSILFAYLHSQNYLSFYNTYTYSELNTFLRGRFSSKNNFQIISQAGSIYNQMSFDGEFYPYIKCAGEHFYLKGENQLKKVIFLQQLGTFEYTTDQTHLYPYGSADCYDKDNNIVSNLRLRFVPDIEESQAEPTEQLLNTLTFKYWKSFIDWKLKGKRIVKRKLVLTAGEIKNFDFSKKYKIGEIIYLCKNLQYTIKRNSITDIEGTFIPL